MIERSFIIHRHDGRNQLIKEAEAIQNAQEQERDGVKPMYSYLDPRTRERITPPGWLVWSTYADGAGVVYKRPEDGKYIVVTGWQAYFSFG